MDSIFDPEEFWDFDILGKDLIKRMKKEMEEIERALQSGKLKGNWDVEKIDKPGITGFIIKGYWQSDKPEKLSDPFEPIEPLRRKKKPLELPETELKESREPLTDVMEDENTVKIYVELPGEEETDIKTGFKDNQVEIKAKKFYTAIDLPTKNIDKEKTTKTYKNGVLEITIPKRKTEPTYYKI